MPRSQVPPSSGMELEYPMSLGVYDKYAEAEHAADYLAGQGFPVKEVEIVGTELRSIERLTGRMTRGTVAAAGTLSGLWMGVFVGLAFSLFSAQDSLVFLIATPMLGAIFGLVWSQLGYGIATKHGSRDFLSASRIVATKYEVLVEHKSAARGRELLLSMPRATTF